MDEPRQFSTHWRSNDDDDDDDDDDDELYLSVHAFSITILIVDTLSKIKQNLDLIKMEC